MYVAVGNEQVDGSVSALKMQSERDVRRVSRAATSAAEALYSLLSIVVEVLCAGSSLMSASSSIALGSA